MLRLVHRGAHLGKSPLFLLFVAKRVNSQILHRKEVSQIPQRKDANQILQVPRADRLK